MGQSQDRAVAVNYKYGLLFTHYGFTLREMLLYTARRSGKKMSPSTCFSRYDRL
jgi:hypothetical protein